MLLQQSLLIKIKCMFKYTPFTANLIPFSRILTYPQGVPGAVNITNGDLARLKPGEYLNDTLIEFGLKRVYCSTLSTHGTYLSQIVVERAGGKATRTRRASAYFQFVLLQEAEQQEKVCYRAYLPTTSFLILLPITSDAAAFETVRKWTSKFDIFQKKYIIVPINEQLAEIFLISHRFTDSS